MSSPIGTAPIDPSPVLAVARPGRSRGLAVLAIVASGAAMAMLAIQAGAWTPGTGIVPAAVPWLMGFASIGVGVLVLSRRRMPAVAWSVLLGVLVVVIAWILVAVLFDLLRLLGLVPSPADTSGAGTRILLLTGATCALVAVTEVQRAIQDRCPECRRVAPGRLDTVPRRPVILAVSFTLVYPALRLIWAIGGTFGTGGQALEIEAAVAWGAFIAGAALVAAAMVLLFGRGPAWVRALLGLGGAAVGLVLTMVGALGGISAAAALPTQEVQSIGAGGEMMTWTFLLVYGSWFVGGLGILAASWRFWVHRRDDCSTCRVRIGRA